VFLVCILLTLFQRCFHFFGVLVCHSIIIIVIFLDSKIDAPAASSRRRLFACLLLVSLLLDFTSFWTSDIKKSMRLLRAVVGCLNVCLCLCGLLIEFLHLLLFL